MAYNRQVVWPSPFSNQFLPLGVFGIVWTEVTVDVPTIDLRRDIWDVSDTLIVNPGDLDPLITMGTAIPYMRGSLRVYLDEELGNFTESEERVKDTFILDKQQARDKYIYASYIPSDINTAIGDNRNTIFKSYGIIGSLRYNKKLREIMTLFRTYTENMCKHLSIEPPLWIGGKNNQDVGLASNLLPGVTPSSKQFHLVPIAEKIKVIRSLLIKEGFQNIAFLKDEEFTVSYIENMQKVLIDIDIALEERG